MLKPGKLIGPMLVDQSTMTVATDVFCVQCEYNLRTLAIVGQCPECGQPVAKSLRPADLCYAASDWLAEVRHGFARATFGAAAFSMCVLLAFVAVSVRVFAGPYLMSVALVGGVIGLAAALSGVSRVVAPDCMPAVSGEPRFARRVAQGAKGVLLVASVPIVIGLGALREFAPLAPGFIAGLTGVLGAAFGGYIRWYARRGRTPRLEKITTVAVWLIAACGVGGLYLSVFWFLSSSVPGRATGVRAVLLSLGSLAGLGAATAIVLFIVTSAVWTVVMFLYWRMFDKACVISRKLEKAALDPNG